MNRARFTLLSVLFAALASSTGCASEGGGSDVETSGRLAKGEVRGPVVAGAFYPGGAAALADDVDRYMEAAGAAKLDGELVALISPHAGYVYSGGVAAHAYVLLRQRSFDTVIVVAPSHRFGFAGASVYGGDGYATPLGVVPVDRELADAISSASPTLRYEPRAHLGEHSLEVQVPFLQRALGGFRMVPIVMGGQSESDAQLLADALAAAVRERSGMGRILLVASTDLSHFHGYEEAVALDSVVLDAVNAFDPEGLLGALGRGDCEACGGGPMAAVMMAARTLGADTARVLKYANSGDVTGDMTQVVGYMAAALTKSGAGGTGSPTGHGSSASETATDGDAPQGGLSRDEKVALLGLARSAIESAMSRGPQPKIEALTPALEAECGAFVTLHRNGRLRGCIGYIRAVKPLHRTVAEMAVQAATQDPRFPAVTIDELPLLDIEISVLSPLQSVADVGDIVVGRDGLIIQDGTHSGLLLPQVATEYGWDRETFLEHTCLKAGLPPDAWRREGVAILSFTAEVFGEAQLF
jgi:AmmeMemoRadiSam system protein B/AmmeMemoRadiSam system protein A